MPQATGYVFASDRELLYDVDPWNRLGFGVPNFGNNPTTLCRPIYALADEIGRAQLAIMTHIDAQRRQPPSINTVRRLAQLCNRVAVVLSGRAKSPTDLRLEENHATANAIPWMIHPVPYFNSAVVRNHWLGEYNRLCMIALTNMYQHSDNNLALTVTDRFAAAIAQYFGEIGRLVGTELLGLDPEVVTKDGFRFDETHFVGYSSINERTLQFEAMDTPGPIDVRITEDDLRPLAEGIPSTVIYPNLKAYPVGPGGFLDAGQTLPDAASATGTADGSAVGTTPPPGFGQPTL